MSRRFFLLASFTAALLAAPRDPKELAKAGMDPGRLALIPIRMKEFVDKGRIAGAVTLVARHGVVAAHDAVGWQDIERKIPMKPDSIFQVMSMTKPVTAVAIMMLVDEGRVGLLDPVEKHIPEFRGQMMISEKHADGRVTLKKPSRTITVRDLLTHTSGMPTTPPPGLAQLYQKLDRTLAEATLVYSQMPLEFEPGSQWLYSNPGIATLGRIVEVASDMPFERFLDTRIFKPLGMNDSFLFPPEDKKPRIADVYRLNIDKLERAGGDSLGGDAREYRKGAVYSGPEFALYSTAADLAAFYEMARAGGAFNGKRLLSRAAVDVMSALHTGDIKAGHNPGTGFGLGWEVAKDPAATLNFWSPGTYGHGGAFGTHGYIDKQRDLVGVYLVQGGPVEGKYAFIRMAAAAVIE